MESDCLKRDIPPPLAIIGLSFQFPGDAASQDAFWDMLVQGRCASTEFPGDRMSIDSHYNANRDQLHSISCRGGHFLTRDLAAFDAPFFNMSDTEAKAMDPQQRLALETVYRALENAGLPMDIVAGSKTSVMAGSFCNDYHMLQNKDALNVPKNATAGNSKSMIANRISWFFDLLGPSATVDTACSSSLMAVDLACQSLWSGDATMGIALGCNVILAPEMTIGLDNLGLMSRDSRCYSFDSRANGYARGEGVGAVVIKRLDDAVAAGDTVRAIIRSSSSNQDGKTPGILQPSKDAQVRLICDTYKKAALDMGMTRYFEAHGTGTPVGDPIETRAIGSAFHDYRSRGEPLYVGSVKSNIGHLEGASGIAGLIKAVLILEKGIIPPNSSNLQSLNPQIDEQYFNLKILTRAIAWPSPGLRRASVNSFGFGGANSHVVLDDAYNTFRMCGIEDGRHQTVIDPPLLHGLETSLHAYCHLNEKPDCRHPQTSGTVEYASEPTLLVWSAADEPGIRRLADSWRKYFSAEKVMEGPTGTYLHDLAFTFCARRSQLAWRSFVVAKPSEDLRSITEKLSPPVHATANPRIGFVFTGQGAQWYAMGRELIDRYDVFRDTLIDLSKYLKSLGCEWDILDELKKSASDTRVNDPAFGQPLCTALQIALLELFASWHLSPAAVVGHSSGEIAAAYCAGAITKHAALKIAYYRGYLAGHLGKSSPMRGAMLAVGLSKGDVQKYLKSIALHFGELKLDFACINSPTSVTISGQLEQIDFLHQLLTDDKVFSRKLAVNVAYHSFQMKEIADRYQELLGELEQPVTMKKSPVMVSSVTGTWTSDEELSKPEYWVRNMVSPVLFDEALALLCPQSRTTTRKFDGSHRHKVALDHLLELGPHSALKGPCEDILKAAGKQDQVSYIPLLRRGISAVECMMQSVGCLHCSGYPIDLTSVISACELGRESQPRVLIDLPEYPFNHSKSYWFESRLSKGYRFRQFGHTELLGTPEPDGNPMEARWRNIIRLSEMPWVEDHQINNSILYPGAGMVVMAIEAIKQLADRNRSIAGFDIRDAVFSSALQIPTNAEGIEVGVYLKRVGGAKKDATGWFEYRICTYENESWVENSSGSVQAYYKADESVLNVGHRDEDEWQACLVGKYQLALERCTTHVDSVKLYQKLRSCGYHCGPAFQVIERIGHKQDEYRDLIAKIRTFQPSSIGGSTTYPEHTIHPATLDGVVQMMAALETEAGQRTVPVYVPTRIHRLWISNAGGLSHPSTDAINVYATSTRSAIGDTRYCMTAYDRDASKALLTLEGLRVTAIASPEASSPVDQFKADNLCHRIEYKPDADLLSNSDFETAFSIEKLQDQSQREELMELDASDFGSIEWRHHMDDEAYVSKTHERVESTSKRGLLVSTICKNLIEILDDPLPHLFKDNLLSDVYSEMLQTLPATTALKKYINALAHKNPRMNILEVGAGTGAMTELCIQALSSSDPEGSPRYAQWDYTDISSSFFPDAVSRFETEKQRMNFRVLDIEQDPEIQGFECGSYDLVVAFLVLHATVDLKTSLRNVRKLLKVGGKLLLFEITHPDPVRASFVFGLFEGWWRAGEPYRQDHPCVDVDDWEWLLKETGFSGCVLAIDDYVDKACHEGTLIVASAVSLVMDNESTTLVDPATAGETNPPNSDSQKEINIVHDTANYTQAYLAGVLAQILFSIGFRKVMLRSIEDIINRDLSSDVWDISLLDFNCPFTYNMTGQEYEALQQLMTTTTNLIWVDGGGGREPSPQFRLVDGLFRVLARELCRAKITTLSLEQDALYLHQAEQIVKVFKTVISPTDDSDTEYREIDGVIHTGRLVSARAISQAVAQMKLPHQQMSRAYGAGPPLRLEIGTPGLLHTLRFVEDKSLQNPLQPDEVEIKVKTVGLNFRDVLIALGRLESDTLGPEFAGIVVRVGSECQRFKAGDRVVVFHPSRYANFVRVREDMAVIKIPDDTMFFATAAAIPVAYATAWITLRQLARLQPGESILVHSGAGGTGQAVIQVARHLGATIFTTVSTEEKKQLLMERYHIPGDHIFSSRNTLFAKGVKRLTDGRGVDVIINSLSGDSLIASWECIAPFGRFIEIGKNDILTNTKLPMLQFEKNVSFSAVDLAEMAFDRPRVIKEALGEIFPLIKSGRLALPEPVQTFGIADLEHAFRHLQGGRNFGKVVLELKDDDQVMTVLDTKSSFEFEGNATYVIAGGLGGLGRNIASWFVERGARNLILLSRSGPKGEHARELVAKLQQKGARVVTPACDITDPASLKTLLDVCSQVMPPIKGCVQASMVVRSGNFETLDYDSWKACTAPKAQGSWNLHELLPRGMDFFVMLSSISGICGPITDASYAAGNTYLDGLARYRVSQGEKAVSLDLGLFLSAGYFHENPDKRDLFLANTVWDEISEADLHALLDIYCNPNGEHISTPLESQVVVGITPRTAEMGRAKADWMKRPFFRHLASLLETPAQPLAAAIGGSSLAARFAGARTTAEAVEVALQATREKVSIMLSVPVDEIDVDRAIHQYGVDSLAAVELRNWFSREMQAEIAVFDILGGASIASVVTLAVGTSRFKREDE
ncbi:type I polyketide synthase [Aspergillus homomorphus CBS 101889]|uniref:Polyketide synthase n=1 Tax=Aspergillus homomorphus (strain CBS 101889) TaxID=1450537 RepID=A0A395I2B0_ASPHC|nr:polyketide synthase [Aspergillus homomorphus CBS 101889]RAL14312.1 polyketide synthase [Aspergillus homomorphus CBS 101889]